ncbi:hypothetical protein GIB67_006965 [Kingdonia uniflora]|uniref:Uncharacterized protein n=1 Tax=Kingdonia uniflora TaxID=39325 RepID=A0A7J7NZQ2_9MAGN|nr:hypothetical protein GIB67_006965 [Kingdonia uniflora]
MAATFIPVKAKVKLAFIELYTYYAVKTKGYALIEYEKFEKTHGVLSRMDGIELLTQIVTIDWASSNGPIK